MEIIQEKDKHQKDVNTAVEIDLIKNKPIK